jgi:hypothetical protein
MSEYTKYVDWLADKLRESNPLMAVTYQHNEELKCEVLKWENSDAKWYRKSPYEGWEEAGGYFDIWTGCPGANARIIHIRTV